MRLLDPAPARQRTSARSLPDARGATRGAAEQQALPGVVRAAQGRTGGTSLFVYDRCNFTTGHAAGYAVIDSDGNDVSAQFEVSYEDGQYTVRGKESGMGENIGHVTRREGPDAHGVTVRVLWSGAHFDAMHHMACAEYEKHGPFELNQPVVHDPATGELRRHVLAHPIVGTVVSTSVAHGGRILARFVHPTEPGYWDDYYLSGECTPGDEMVAVDERTVTRSAACAARYAEQERALTDRYAPPNVRILTRQALVSYPPGCCVGCGARPPELHASYCTVPVPDPHIPPDVPKQAIDRPQEAAGKPMDTSPKRAGRNSFCARAAARRSAIEVAPRSATKEEVAATLDLAATITNHPGWALDEPIDAAIARALTGVEKTQAGYAARVIAILAQAHPRIEGRGKPSAQPSAVAALTHERVAPPRVCEGCDRIMLRVERYRCGACGHLHGTTRAQ